MVLIAWLMSANVLADIGEANKMYRFLLFAQSTTGKNIQRWYYSREKAEADVNKILDSETEIIGGKEEKINILTLRYLGFSTDGNYIEKTEIRLTW